MGKHTPGPWVKEGLHYFGSNGEMVVVSDGPSFGSRSTFPSAEANAQLISAAPEMLEALEAATECGLIPTSSASEGGAAKYARQVVVADMIRAAIAKAKGEQ